MVLKLPLLWWPMCAVVQVDMPAGAARVAAIVQHELVSVTLATHCHALYPILPLVCGIHAHGLVILVYHD